MTRRLQLQTPIDVLLALAVALTLAAACGSVAVAQEPAPTLEGTSRCDAVSQWFADVYARQARKGSPAVEPYLVLFNGGTEPQLVTVTASTGVVVTRTLAPKERVTLDVWTAIAKRLDANFALDVAFERYGAADVRMWSNGSVVSTSLPLTVCRNGA